MTLNHVWFVPKNRITTQSDHSCLRDRSGHNRPDCLHLGCRDQNRFEQNDRMLFLLNQPATSSTGASVTNTLMSLAFIVGESE